MRLIRYKGSNGPAYASLQPDGSAKALNRHPLEGVGPLREVGEPFSPGELLAPVIPPAIFGVGLNYRAHADAMGKPIPEFPLIFVKTINTIQDPGAPILIPKGPQPSKEVDYECELAVVIGKAAHNVRRDNALDYVLGYTIANDVTARDWQFKWGGGQFTQGKCFNTFCPIGPFIVTADELPDPASLRIRTRLNDEIRQDSDIADLIFDVPALIEFLSSSKTLLPGTLILTGTPAGVGATSNPPRFLQPGDRVTIEIDGIGSLSNPVLQEAD
jgi:2-keto-4-pentenoate hydratase/2-oxohepta-3-ene-1,7-dioic acid hydratase in catechol pathway